MPRDQTCKDLSIIIPLSSTETEQRHLLAKYSIKMSCSQL